MEMFFYYRNLHAGDEVVFVCVPSSLSGMESAAADYGIELFQLPDSGLLQDLGTAHVGMHKLYCKPLTRLLHHCCYFRLLWRLSFQFP